MPCWYSFTLQDYLKLLLKKNNGLIVMIFIYIIYIYIYINSDISFLFFFNAVQTDFVLMQREMF